MYLSVSDSPHQFLVVKEIQLEKLHSDETTLSVLPEDRVYLYQTSINVETWVLSCKKSSLLSFSVLATISAPCFKVYSLIIDYNSLSVPRSQGFYQEPNFPQRLLLYKINTWWYTELVKTQNKADSGKKKIL